jgi:HEAT repeat protein
MPIQTRCPTCRTAYNLPDARRGKRVRCKQCEAVFLVAEGPEAEGDREERVRADPRPGRARVTADAPRGGEVAEDEDRPRRGRRERKPAKPSSLLPLLLGGGVGLLLLLGAGAGLAYYLIAGRKAPEPQASAPPPPDAAAKLAAPAPAEKPPERPSEDKPANPPAPPPAPTPDPAGGPTTIDEALAMLREANLDRRNVAADWLAQKAPLDESRRNEVSKALDPLLPEEKTRLAGVKAVARWATRANVPSLLALLGDASAAVWGSAVETLGRLQDARAAGPLAKLLLDAVRREAAVRALRALGKAAGEKEVLKYLHHKDAAARAPVPDVLRGYGTAEVAILDQTVSDLESTEDPRRRLALDDLARRKRNPARRDKVAKALEGLLTDLDPKLKTTAMSALGEWASKDNTPALVGALRDPQLKDAAIALLGKLKAEQAVGALLALFPGPDRAKVTKALQQIGRPAESGTVALLNTALSGGDLKLVKDLIRLLGNVGTRGVSLPLLQRLAANKASKAIANDCKNAIKKIQNRP